MMILAVDPGVTTGLCLHNTDTPEEFVRLELGPQEHHTNLFQFLNVEQVDTVVCERFEYRIIQSGGTTMPGVRLESREYIGVVKLWCGLTQTPLEMQAVGGVKSLFTDAKLKGLGLYQAPSGRQHMNDATRHMLYYLVVTLKLGHYLDKLKPPPTHPTQTEA